MSRENVFSLFALAESYTSQEGGKPFYEFFIAALCLFQLATGVPSDVTLNLYQLYGDPQPFVQLMNCMQ